MIITRLTLIILGIITYLISIGFLVYIGMDTYSSGEVIGVIMFIIISLSVGTLLLLMPFLLGLTSLFLTLKLNKQESCYSKILPLALRVLPIISEIILVVIILIKEL